VPSAEHERLKNAWYATRIAPTLSMLAATTFEEEVSRLEREYNEGRPFPAPPANARGRSSRESTEGYRNHGYFHSTALHERMKAAWWGTRDIADTGASLSAFVARLITAKADQLEREHNEGRPFPPAPAGARGVDPEAARRQSEKLSQLWQQRRDDA
jgi:hypothetical protein